MVLKNQKSTKKVALILALFLLFMSVDLVFLTAQEEEKEEYRSCDEALKKCLGDNLTRIILDPRIAIYCAAGWIFCKRYVEKHLPKK